MSLLDDFRVNIGDDAGAIPSGIFPVPSSGLPVGANTTPLSELRVDIGDDDDVIPSGTLAGGIFVHDLLSPQHGDTTPASPSPSDLIRGGGTWNVLPSGNEGEVLSIFQGTMRWAVDAAGASGLAAHAADPNAHHTRYTDAEASGVAVQVVTTGILEHTNLPSAHHARYTDAEAIAAASGALNHHLRYTDAEASGVAVQVVVTGIAQHAAIPDAHHVRYTDAEASGIAVQVATTGIAQHAAIPDVHHSRYTDSEASGVAVQVVTTGIAEHAAISGAHHPRYTNAEAAIVAAAVLATGVISADNVAILQESGVELTVDATTTSVLPITSTLLTSSINLINPSGNLRIMATAAVNASAGVPVVFHVYIDGVFYRGTTVNVTGAIDNAAIIIPRVAVTGVNPHTVELKWAKFSLPLATVRCLPVTFPDFYHASLSVQEVV